MQHGIVEGEPGIFPDPIARFMRGVGRFFDRKKGDDQPRQSATPPADPTGGPEAPDTGSDTGTDTDGAPRPPT